MLKPKFTRNSVHKYTQKQLKIIERLIIRKLLKLGEEAVNLARQNHTYIDQTGNLTSSIGYELFVNGIAYHEDFQAFAGGSESGEEGVLKGKAHALAVGPLGSYSLVIVAGMDYAEEVQARGKDVLSSAETYVTQELPKIKIQILNEFKLAAA